MYYNRVTMTAHPTTVKRIAILRLSAIGDVVMMVPMVKALRKHFPEAKIYWITTQAALQILQGLPEVEFIVIEKPKSLRQWWQARKCLRKYQFDILLAAQASGSANLLCPLIKAKRKIGFDKERARDGHGLWVNERIEARNEHILDGFMGFIRALGVPEPEVTFSLPISVETEQWAQAQLDRPGRWIAINPMASKLERNWPQERYVQLINQLADQYSVNIVLTGGPSSQEVALSQAIADEVKADCLLLTGKTNLKQLVAILQTADVLIAPDTGPVHIARAVDTPVVGLYAVMTGRYTGPYQAQDYCVDRYAEAVQKYLNKDPKEVSWRQRVHHVEAMQLIGVRDVMEAVERALSSTHCGSGAASC
jgi:heptosyltransferase I